MLNQHAIKRPVKTCECGQHAWVTLTRGHVSLINPEDAEFVGQWNWSTLMWGPTRRAAVRRKNSGGFFYLHREITGAPSGKEVDHISGDTLDNRRENLRVCDPRLNHRNVSPHRKKTSSRFKGVYHDKERGQWQAYINVDGVRHRLGRFHSELDAALAYDSKATELHGEYAKTNASLGLLP